MTQKVTAFAPASIGNLGVGFDMLGLALEGVGDRVSARRTEEAGVSVAEVRGLDGELHPYLSTDPDHNTASIAAQALVSSAPSTEMEAASTPRVAPVASAAARSTVSWSLAVVLMPTSTCLMCR